MQDVKLVSQKLRDSARGQECTLRLPGICNFDPATTVLCHLPVMQRGIAIKSPDLASCFGCSSCHDAIDGRVPYKTDARDLLRAMTETQMRWLDMGLLIVAGESAKERPYKPLPKILPRNTTI